MIWLQWIFNVVWFPSALVFIAATGLAWLNPALLDHQLLLMGTVVGLFTVATFINWRGMEVSSLFTNFCATIGTMLPLVGLILLGYAWMHQHHVASIDWSKPIMPSLGHLDNISYLVAVLFGLIGIEMSATHAEETLNPKRNFPRAIFISILAIVLSLVLASLAMNAILSDQVLDDVTGVIQSFHLLADKMHLQYLEGFMAITIVIGSIGQIAAWIIGPSKGLLVACGDGALPPVWSKQNRHGVPTTILLAQLGIVAVMSVLILLFPDIKTSYFILTIMTTQLALVGYIILGVAALKLVKSEQGETDCYQIPGGLWGAYTCIGLTLFSCIGCFLLGFIPPPEIRTTSLGLYEFTLGFGLIAFLILPMLMIKRKQAP